MYFAKVQLDYYYYLKIGSAQSNAARRFGNISSFLEKTQHNPRLRHLLGILT
jgi:hypothetical protein